MIVLNDLELTIADYLEKNTCKNKTVGMKDLSEMFGINVREVRAVVENIILAERLVIGNVGGYWVAKTDEEIELANLMTVSRAKKSLERILANGGDLNFVYDFVKKTKAKYDKIPDGQVSIYERN